MQQKLMKKTAVFSAIFFLISMGIIIYMSVSKVITIEGVAQDEVNEVTVAKEDGTGEDAKRNLTFQLGEADSSYLRIPLPEGCKADDIMIENHYMDKELWIFVPSTEKDFYEQNAISGNREAIEQGTFENRKEGIALNFRLTGIYECRTILENENLYISFLAPGEVYDKIIVIDPAGGGDAKGIFTETQAEKDIALEIARKLKVKLDESDIKAYYTRMDDVNSQEEDRIALGNETKADMYIRIEVNEAKDTGVYGITAVYNGDYFIPSFGNIELADCLEREVTTSVKGKALGLVSAGEKDVVLEKLTVPAATIKVGYLSNSQEAILLSRDEYQDKIATGIYDAITKIYAERH
ncbi:MAG: N-acetylmuramoyl-L-alanine amidase [Lachnospiraceae bacterium]|nr:N-acetylmuramoyl-L-alanine amidase [Lachnospiraceae bacterium]MDD7628910.1 N-acetylmuramoyl-L-alanine amidase [Lachnospiraceae bacterium]MDY4120405.1 N-acetylmuramoyl-L-alanine amidase [Lachnospiraceae bacterium]